MKITTNRRLFLQGTAVTGVAAALAGCSQQSADEQKKQADADNKKKADEQAALPSTAWERAEYDAVKDGGTITLAIAQIPVNWNPLNIDGNQVDTRRITEPMGNTSGITITEEGAVELDPNYIESAEVTSEDPQIVTVKYNSKAKWENGKPVTVEDFKSQVASLNGSNKAFTITSTQGWDLIKEVRPKGEHDMEIEYTTPFPDWMSFLYPTVPQEVTADPKAFNESLIEKPTLSKGPYKLSSLDKTGGVVTLERNPEWWGQKGKLDTVIFQVVTQQNQPQSFANGELDYLEIGDGDTLGQAKGRKGASIQKSNGLTWTHLTLNINGGGGALADVEARKAIFKAVDREAVSRAVVAPLESPINLVNNYVYLPGQDGYEDSFDGFLDSADAKKAEKILTDAGYTKDGDVYAKDGKKLEFEIVIPAETKSNEDRAKQIMNDLNAIGFKVKLKTVPSDKYFNDYIIAKDFSAATFSWVGTVLAELHGANLYLPDSNQNYTGVDDQKLATLNEQMQQELDPDKRRTVGNEFSKQQASTYSVLPFYATPIIVGLTEGLVNIGASQFETFDWTTVGFKA